MSFGELVPKRSWHQMRYEQQTENTGIHGKPENGNHIGTVTLIESVEILTNPREGVAKARHEQIQ